mmetsp:Transcript_100751/g.313281  ORF Transcript_100751/g.313281 Transcript_100751/m.313281 type:complete len:228 (-) Transcript_100751:961-1644(-)
MCPCGSSRIHSFKYQSLCCCMNWKTSVASSASSWFLSGCHRRQRNLKVFLREATSSFWVFRNCARMSSMTRLSAGSSVGGTSTWPGCDCASGFAFPARCGPGPAPGLGSGGGPASGDTLGLGLGAEGPLWAPAVRGGVFDLVGWPGGFSAAGGGCLPGSWRMSSVVFARGWGAPVPAAAPDRVAAGGALPAVVGFLGWAWLVSVVAAHAACRGPAEDVEAVTRDALL